MDEDVEPFDNEDDEDEDDDETTDKPGGVWSMVFWSWSSEVKMDCFFVDETDGYAVVCGRSLISSTIEYLGNNIRFY